MTWLRIGFILVLSAAAAPSRAQISPGELSRAHAALEGSTQCLKCHESGRGVAVDKCLSCHTALGARIQAQKGLHAQAGHQECGRCHIEHQGRAFDLVFWGKAGRDAFDHGQTGYPLEGPHARLRCQQCHEPGRLGDPARLVQGAANVQPTFLGLSRECVSCHTDVHRGRFAPAACTSCHAQTAWRPAPGFDHARTRFSLVGEHQKVACDRCHTAEAPGGPRRLGGLPFDTCKSCHKDPHVDRLGARCASCHSPQGWRVISASFEHERTAFPLTGAHRKVSCDQCHKTEASTSRRVFRGTAFQSCTACHRDSHAGRLGQSCTTCHTTQSWSAASTTFDHSKSGYPLLGRHAAVKCAECHSAGRPRRLAHAACTDCHSDHHLGQLARRADGGRCEACHDVSGFAQPRFSTIDHEKTPFPLTGAHRAVACDECHRKVPVEQLRTLGVVAATGKGETEQLRFPSTTCATCHTDPHAGTTARVRAECRTCHRTATWRTVEFDHAATGFALQGAHAAVACAGCHAREGSPRTARASLRFGGAPTGCTDCHKDRHEGRFAREGTTTCTRCHQPTRWADVRFDHDRETRFALDGAHVRVACARCHRDAAGVARYRGLPLTCAGCHQATP
ncbi:MAG: cytochrome c3 family protein [Solirubrobacterales bacterium]